MHSKGLTRVGLLLRRDFPRSSRTRRRSANLFVRVYDARERWEHPLPPHLCMDGGTLYLTDGYDAAGSARLRAQLTTSGYIHTFPTRLLLRSSCVRRCAPAVSNPLAADISSARFREGAGRPLIIGPLCVSLFPRVSHKQNRDKIPGSAPPRHPEPSERSIKRDDAW